jgi:hypothetical protein
VRGLPADFGRPAVSGQGRRCQGASPRGEGPIWGIGGGGPHRGGLAMVTQVNGGNRRWQAGEDVESVGLGSWSGGELGRRLLQ